MRERGSIIAWMDSSTRASAAACAGFVRTSEWWQKPWPTAAAAEGSDEVSWLVLRRRRPGGFEAEGDRRCRRRVRQRFPEISSRRRKTPGRTFSRLGTTSAAKTMCPPPVSLCKNKKMTHTHKHRPGQSWAYMVPFLQLVFVLPFGEALPEADT